MEDIQNIQLDFVFHMYSTEMIKVQRDSFLTGQKYSLESMIKKIHRDEIDQKGQSKRVCSYCRSKPILNDDETMLLSTPDVFGISI